MKKLLMAAVACLAAAMTWGRSLSVDLRQPTAGAGARTAAKLRTASSGAGDSDFIRRVNLDAGAADVGAVAVGDELSFALFDDVSITLTLKEQMPSPLGGDVFLAEAAGYEGVKNAVVLRTEDGLTVDVQDFLKRRVYKVVSTPSGVSVQEMEAKRGECGCDALPTADPEKASAPSAHTGRKTVAAKGAEPDTCVDVLVAYDKNAAAWTDANGGGITNFAQVAVQKMNTALANTGLDEKFRFRLVGVTTVSVSASDVHEALHAIEGDLDGWSDIMAVRETVGADIVTTLIDTGSAYGSTGVGKSLSNESRLSSFGDSAYNVCAVRSVQVAHTMTHEVGHNMGAGHAAEQTTQPGPQLYDYSAGFYFVGMDGVAYCTVMAYGDEGPGGTEIPYFSSPSHAYSGVAVGDSLHDNTRTLANTCSYAANWRAQKVPTSYGIVFSPGSGALIDGSLSVALTPGRAGTEIRYTLDGSAPTASSPLYTGAITLTRTTTIKAATVVDGAVSIPFAATYYAKDDYGVALGLPDIVWTATGDWRVQTTNTVDDVGLETPGSKGGSVAKLSAQIRGPVSLSFRYRPYGSFDAEVLCDGGMVWSPTTMGSAWRETAVDIPDGLHDVAIVVETLYGDDEYSFALDDMRLYTVQKPTMDPATTSAESSAATFADEQMVSLSTPSAGASIYYTLDGSDPNGEGAILYDGPFFVAESTCVKAIAKIPGRGTSVVATGYYLRREQPKAGEWTLWGEAAYEAVQRDGRMIADLNWNYPGCGWSAALEPVVTSPAFLTWAGANGVYLLAGSWGDVVGASGSRFGGFYRQTPLYEELDGWIYWPTFVFASAADVTKCSGAMLARNDGEHKANGHYYTGTPESLIECFASYLDAAAPLGAPVASVTDATGLSFPFSVTLSNTNGTGTIYYTLDGSVPTRTGGTRYTGAIAIPSAGTTLRAVVWPDGAGGVSGIPLVVSYELFGEVVGVDGMAWTNDAGLPWTIARKGSGVGLSGGKDTSLASGTATSVLKAAVNGPGEIRFRYTIFTRGGSKLSFSVNGSEVDSWTYASNAEFVHEVSGAGATELSWTYEYSADDSMANYYCQIYDVAWTPFSAPDPVTGLTASGGEHVYGTLLRWAASGNAASYAVYRGETSDAGAASQIGTTTQFRYWDTSGAVGKTYYYWVKAVNDYGESGFSAAASGWRPETCHLSYNANGGSGTVEGQICRKGGSVAVADNSFRFAGHVFDGWATGAGGAVAYKPGDAIVLNSDVTLYAVWSASPFEFGGSADWTRLDDGSWQSGAIEDSQSTWIQRTVSGPGTLTFDWKVSSEEQYDTLDFFIDDVELASVSGTGGAWSTLSFTVDGSGAHVLKWCYSKDGSDDGGSDCGWVRNVAWKGESPSGSCVVSFQANGGSVSPATRTVASGSTVGTLPTPTRSGYTFAGWFTAASGGSRVSASAKVTADVTYYAHWTKNDAPAPTPTPTPEPEELHGLYAEVDGAAPETAASEYNGYLYDAKGGVKGSIQVKVGKPGKDGKAAVKATIVLGAKKLLLKAAENGKAEIAAGGPTIVALAGGESCSVTLGAEGLAGTYGAYTVDGARNFFTSKDTAEVNAANAALEKWLGAVNVVWNGGSVNVVLAKKGKAKVKGTLADGKTKISANSVFLVGEEWCCVPVVAPKANLAFNLWLSSDGRRVVVEGLGGGVLVGAAGALGANAKFRVDKSAALWAQIPGMVLAEYLPDGVAVAQSGRKWTLPKAGKVAYLRGTTEVDETKLGENPSALKLTYKAADGSFKGSFKVYADDGGRLKATTVNVTGVMVNGVGYGTAAVKGKGGVAVTVK